jgi:hypothetical protein
MKLSLGDANDAPSRLDLGLNGTVGGAAISLSFKGLELCDGRSLFMWGLSNYPDCR